MQTVSLRGMAAQHVDHGKSIAMNNNRERRFAHHHASTSSIGAFSHPHIDSVICPSTEDTIIRLENDYPKTNNIDGDNLPHPDKLFSWIWNNSDTGSCEASVARRSVDDRPSLDKTSSTTSKVRRIDLSGESLPGDANDG
ncbi:hypothetical protein BJX63DRAFT_363608 [Aspergillus granulosus]|uniref:Uncharacterized protein n=1 Tax=Aspergillus granulosus TaxID=176169 RepID=A0ABR4HWF4_9EURO